MSTYTTKELIDFYCDNREDMPCEVALAYKQKYDNIAQYLIDFDKKWMDNRLGTGGSVIIQEVYKIFGVEELQEKEITCIVVFSNNENISTNKLIWMIEQGVYTVVGAKE